MSIQISLEDNSKHTLPLELSFLSDYFKDDDETHLHTNIKVFNKLKEFAVFYDDLSDKEKKLFEDPISAIEKGPEFKKWYDNFKKMDTSTLTELTELSQSTKLEILKEVCCYTIAQLIIDAESVDAIRELFDIENDFTPEEMKELEGESQLLS